jgi:hypothetical protein
VGGPQTGKWLSTRRCASTSSSWQCDLRDQVSLTRQGRPPGTYVLSSYRGVRGLGWPRQTVTVALVSCIAFGCCPISSLGPCQPTAVLL